MTHRLKTQITIVETKNTLQTHSVVVHHSLIVAIRNEGYLCTSSVKRNTRGVELPDGPIRSHWESGHGLHVLMEELVLCTRAAW